MSLLERVTTPTTQQTAVESLSNNELRQYVSQLISPSQIAEMIRVNPHRAQNEVKLACTRVLEEHPWIARTTQDAQKLIEQYLASVFGLGPLEPLLRDDSITEVMVNGTDSIFYEREGKLYALKSHFTSEGEVLTLIDRIIAPLGRRIDESSPMVNARLPEGHRVNAIIPPLSLTGPILTIRKFRTKLYSLEELERLNSMEESVRIFLQWAVKHRCNIAVSGGTGSGKTKPQHRKYHRLPGIL